MAESAHQHNASKQTGVEINTDPALDVTHEHRHEHLHHDAFAAKGNHDDVVYSKGTTAERSIIPDQDPLDHALHRRHHPEGEGKSNEKGGYMVDPVDQEKGAVGHTTAHGSNVNSDGEEDPKTHKLSGFYKHYRIFFHIFLFLFFTG